MPLAGTERTFVDYGSSPWLLITTADLARPDFMHRKDVALPVKFSRQSAQGPVFFHLNLKVKGGTELWSRAVEGDNFFLLGTLLRNENALVMTLSQVVPAPSDAEVISARLEQVPADDFPGRLAVAAWCQDSAVREGNTQFWNDTARSIAQNVARDAATKAAKDKNPALLLQAMDWAIDKARDPRLAADLGGAEWVIGKDATTTRAVTERMQKLGFRYHEVKGDERKGWFPVAESLGREFEIRFQAIDWRDARSYFELGRWVDGHADLVGNARSLSHRAYMAGHRADPTHNGINRELGLELVTATSAKESKPVFRRQNKGLEVLGPDGWTLSAEPVSGLVDASWLDARSETAWLGIKVIEAPDLESAWRPLLGQLQALGKFEDQGGEGAPAKPHELGPRIIRPFSYQEGSRTKLGRLDLIQISGARYCILLLASFVAEEQEQILKALDQTAQRITIAQPKGTPAKGEPKSSDQAESKAPPKGEFDESLGKPPAEPPRGKEAKPGKE